MPLSAKGLWKQTLIAASARGTRLRPASELKSGPVYSGVREIIDWSAQCQQCTFSG